MYEYVIPIDAVLQSGVGHVGAKAAVLGALLRAGYPVPPGLCVTTAAFDLAIQPCASEINAIIEGSIGQYAAATAREYGVPAVIETRDATRRIPDGASISVDGTEGRVELDSRRHGDTSKE